MNTRAYKQKYTHVHVHVCREDKSTHFNNDIDWHKNVKGRNITKLEEEASAFTDMSRAIARSL